MNKIMSIFRSCITYSIIGIIFLLFSIPCFIIACLPARWRYDNRIYYAIMAFSYKMVVWFSFVPITIEGKKNIPQEPAIIVANHQSSFDIPLLGSLVNSHPHVWLFLVRFTKIPFFGFILKRMNVVVDHSGLRKLVGSLNETLSILQESKSHVMIFPEGGRYIDGNVHKFYYGFARLAQETKRPVIPVIMFNVNKIYPPGSILFGRYPVHIIVGKPFKWHDYEHEQDFVHDVHRWFVEKTTKE